MGWKQDRYLDRSLSNCVLLPLRLTYWFALLDAPKEYMKRLPACYSSPRPRVRDITASAAWPNYGSVHGGKSFRGKSEAILGTFSDY
jgi:hypothetical protein